jgi:hypothetical protein
LPPLIPRAAVPTAVAQDDGLCNYCGLLQRIFSQNEKNDTPTSAQENFLFIFLIHFEKYTIVSKFISFDHQPLWVHGDRVPQMTCATAVGTLRLKTALKIIKINRKKLFLVEDPLTSHPAPQAASHDIFRAKSQRYALCGICIPYDGY